MIISVLGIRVTKGDPSVLHKDLNGEEPSFIVPNKHVFRNSSISGRKRSLHKKGDPREGLVSNVVFSPGDLSGMWSCEEDVIMSMGMTSKNFSLFFSKSSFLERNNVSIKSKAEGGIGCKRVAVICDDLNPILQGVVPGSSLEYRGCLSRGVIKSRELSSFKRHVGIRVTVGRISIRIVERRLRTRGRCRSIARGSGSVHGWRKVLQYSSKLLQFCISGSEFLSKELIRFFISRLFLKMNSSIGDPRGAASLLIRAWSPFRSMNRDKRRRDTERSRSGRGRNRGLRGRQRGRSTLGSFAFSLPFSFRLDRGIK